MDRKLASIQRVLEIVPIPNADAIELARIAGWQCVVKKGEFVPGDLGVFLEIDSIPPEIDTFRFLWKDKPARPERFRIRTIKLRGTLSQGLLLPLNQFSIAEPAEGQDLTETLGVEKYEPPIPAGLGSFRAPFPAWIPKTDEIRVQSEPGVIDELRGLPYVATIKYDGTSATYCLHVRTGEFHACGRNHSVLDGANHYWNMARKYSIEEKLRAFPHLSIQGEIVGPAIQKNLLALKQVCFFAFNVFDFNQSRYLDHADARSFLAQAEIPAVDVLEQGDDFQHTLPTLLALAEGKYPGTSNEREGMVVRPQKEEYSPTLRGRLSFKVLNNQFLLKEE